MTSAKKPLLAALNGASMAVPPIWLMRQAGRYLPEYRELRQKAGSFLDLCYTPEFAVEATLQPIRRYDLDAAIIFSDILVIPHALGQTVWFEEGKGPMLEPITTASDFDRLDLSGLEAFLQPVYEALSGVREALPGNVGLIGFAGAPWTIASYMVEGGTSRDHGKVRALAYADPALFDRLVALLVGSVTAHLVAQIKAGAEAVQIFDSWAGILSTEHRHRYSLDPIAKIAAGVRKAYPDVPVIAFPRGVGAAYVDYARLADIAAVSMDFGIDPTWAATALQPHATVQGNLDPLALAAGGEGLDRQIDGILDALASGPHIFNLGHGIVPQTPPENVSRLIDRVRSRVG